MKTILLITHRESPAFKSIAESCLTFAKEYDCAAHIVSAGDMREAARLAKAWNCDGCVVYSALPSGLSGDVGALCVPAVCISPTIPALNAPNIVHDSFSTGELAARKLISLGVDRFAFAAAPGSAEWARRRLDGFASELRKCGRKALAFHGHDVGAWLRNLPKPCGLFAANDEMAEKVVVAAAAEGIDIPSDLAVLSCDDNWRICENAETTISSIRQDYRRCGSLAMERLATAMASGRTRYERITFGDEGITERASTRLVAYSSPEISRTLEHIRQNACSGLSPAKVLAKMTGSRRHKELAFRAAVGHSILDEIQAVRLAEAKRLLANPHVKIISIASRVGYRSENFFARLFKRQTGMTMREFRKRAVFISSHSSILH